MERLRISDNRRYFIREDGSFFPWLADTAWTVPARLSWEDVQYYLQTRKQQGFSVLQMVVLDPECNPDMKNPAGIPALQEGDLSRRNVAYFDYVDWVLDEAQKEGFYVLLLPVWGQLVVGDDWGGGTYPKTVTKENAFEYGAFLGAREKNRPNILWCLGGDRMPIHKGTDYRNVWRTLAEGLAYGLTGERLRYDRDREKWEKLLMTYHACHEAETGKCSTFSYWTDEEAWLSFIMLQSGHGLTPKNYELVREEYNRTRTMPVWDGEPAYEMMPTGWPITERMPRHGTYMVRKRAYWSLFAGAFGFTYGHACVWNTVSEKEKNAINKLSWTEALSSEGSGQMHVLRDFMETYHTPTYTPCQEVLLGQAARPDDLDTHAQACVNEKERIMLVYFAKGAEETIDVSRIVRQAGEETAAGTPVYYAWLDPRDGSLGPVTKAQTEVSASKPQTETLVWESQTDESFLLRVHHDAPDDCADWILVVAADPARIRMEHHEYGEKLSAASARKVFAW